MEYKCIIDEFGTKQIHPMPSDSELRSYYANTYFQANTGQYQASYSKSEITHFHLIDKIIEALILKRFNKNFRSFLDVGCGEGFSSKWFFEKGYDVCAVDFSSAGIAYHNPNVLKKINFFQCDIVNDDYFPEQTFDLILLRNVLEHVIDTDKLILRLKEKMNANSILAVMVPNDTKNPILDSYMKRTDKSLEDCKYFCPPDHLRYFSYKSLKRFMKKSGFEQLIQMGEFPIEMFLLDPNTDYYENSFGKVAHSIRCNMSNVLSDLDIEKVINLMTSLADLGLGRDMLSLYIKS